MRLKPPSLLVAALSLLLIPMTAARAAAEAPPPPASEQGLFGDTTVVAAPAAVVAPSAARLDDSASYLPSLDGPIGLYRLSTAEVGPRHHLRFALHGQYFSSNDVLIQGDQDSELSGQLTFGFTPIDHLEIFGGFFTSSNRNTRPSEPGRTDPDVIRSHGDLVLGPKLAAPVARGLDLGFEAGVRLLAATSGLSYSPSATSYWFGPLATLDLRAFGGPPLRLHADVDFYVDNSKNVTDLSGATVDSLEAAKFAYGIAATRLRMAVGFDLPLEKLTGALPLRPFGEYHAEVITADADPALVAIMPRNTSRERQWLTFGLRARVYGGATVDAGADVRLHATGIEYGPPLPPWDVIVGFSYPIDVDALTRPVIVTQTIEKPIAPPPPSDGRIAGMAKDKDGKAIARAVVVVAGRAHAGVVTDADGTFETAALPPGPTTLEVSAADFEPEKVTTAVIAGGVAEVQVALTAKVRTGMVRGKTSDAQGHGVEATLRFSGAQAYETRTDSAGLFSAALLPGPYRVVAEVPGLPSKESQFELAVGGDRQLDMMLRPLSPDLTLADDEIVLRAPIKFRPGAPRLSPAWQAELDGVAAVLEDHPEFSKLRIEGHCDSGVGPKAKDITLAQATTVKDYLLKKGIPEARLEAAGIGSDRPLVPNVSPAYRAKNRRLELHLVR